MEPTGTGLLTCEHLKELAISSSGYLKVRKKEGEIIVHNIVLLN